MGEMGTGAALGGMSSDVLLGGLGGWVDGGVATWNDAAWQVDIWNHVMVVFARAACLPISRTSRRVRGFQRRLRRSPLLRESRSLPRSAHRE